MKDEMFCNASDNFALCYNELKLLKNVLTSRIDPRFVDLERKFDEYATLAQVKKDRRKFDGVTE